MHPLFKICGVATHMAKYSVTCFNLKIKKAMMPGFMVYGYLGVYTH